MACPNGIKWCQGPSGFGSKCLACQKGQTTASTSATGAPQPLAVTTPVPPTGRFVPATPPPIPPRPRFVPPPPQDVPAPASSGGGPKIVLYRGDSREPGIIKQYGFELWGAAIAKVSSSGGIGNYVRELCEVKRTGATLADFVRASRDQSRPTISTASDEGCGGYASGYIYKIEYEGLQEYELDEAVMPSGGKLAWKSGGLRVHMDAPTLLGAKTIVVDLKLSTGEWAFFTKVPPSRITAYKKSNENFMPMSDVTATVKKLW